MTPRNLHIPIGPAGVDYSDYSHEAWDAETDEIGVSLDRTELTKERVVLLCIRPKTADVRIEWTKTTQTNDDPPVVISGDTTVEHERAANYVAFEADEWDGASPPPWVPNFNPESHIEFSQPGWRNPEGAYELNLGPQCRIHKGKFYVTTSYVIFSGDTDGAVGTGSGLFLFPEPDNTTDISCEVSFTDNSMVIESRWTIEITFPGEEGEPDEFFSETIESTYTFTVTSLYEP